MHGSALGWRRKVLKLLLPTTAVLSGCIGLGGHPNSSTTASTAGQTVMLYLPGTRPGQPGITLPYHISPGRQSNSAAAYILSSLKAEATKPYSNREALGRADECRSLPCRVEPARVSWQPRTIAIVARPEQVINTVLSSLVTKKRVDEAGIRANLGNNQVSDAGEVVTSVVSRRYPCASNWDLVPLSLLQAVCSNNKYIEKVSISGQPAQLVDGKLRRLDLLSDAGLWYNRQQLERDVGRAGIGFLNVSAKYDDAWTGHFPRMTSEFLLEAVCNCLVVATTGAGRQPNGPDEDVITIEIYQPTES